MSETPTNKLVDHFFRHESGQLVAVGQRDGPDKAISLLNEIKTDPQLANFHLLDAAYGELHRMSGNCEKAVVYFESAIEKAESPHDKKLLQRRIEQCQT